MFLIVSTPYWFIGTCWFLDPLHSMNWHKKWNQNSQPQVVIHFELPKDGENMWEHFFSFLKMAQRLSEIVAHDLRLAAVQRAEKIVVMDRGWEMAPAWVGSLEFSHGMENSEIFGDGFGVDGVGLDDFLDYAKWGGFDHRVWWVWELLMDYFFKNMFWYDTWWDGFWNW